MFKFSRRLVAVACVQVCASSVVWAQGAPEVVQATLPVVTVKGHYDNAVGTSDAASQGTVTSVLMANRPTLRPGEVLEFVPGMIVTQHSGGGKANQYFLRGFNLDHGTDFATFIDGMPVNMPTHAHGHGYADMNWLIPELVSRMDYRKGPYFAEDGDFSAAGSARMFLFDRLDKGTAMATVGERGFARALVMNGTDVGPGHLLYALELQKNDGPWEEPEDLRRVNGVLRYTFGPAQERSSITFMGYDARWTATDQIPLRAVEQGLVGRFGTLDPTDGGETWRYSLSGSTTRMNEWGQFKANAYAIASRLNLFSNFEFLGAAPDAGQPDTATLSSSQFEQAESRRVFGGGLSQSWNDQWGGREVSNKVGLQWRHDRLSPVGLYGAENGVRTGVTQESRVRQTSVGIHGENVVQWLPWLRSIAGLRFDHHDFDVKSSIEANSGQASADLVSPKLSLVMGPWSKTEYFLNYGQGFHSNDARGTTARVDAADPSQSVDAVKPLVRARGAEFGLRTEVVPGLQSSFAVWRLTLDSELVFVGDAGTTEASRSSKREGIEWNNHWVLPEGFLLDFDVAMSRARFRQQAPEGDRIPGAVDRVVSAGLTRQWGPWLAGVQVRHFGPRPLIEDGSVKSSSTTLTYARLGYRVSPTIQLTADVFNLFDRKDNDIEYFYESRLPGEAQPVADRHFHPVEPRTVRVTLKVDF